MKRILQVLTVALITGAMLAASAAPAMAFNTFQFPVLKDPGNKVLVEQEEPGQGGPAVSGGPNTFVYHCDEGAQVAHEAGEGAVTGPGECAPKGAIDKK